MPVIDPTAYIADEAVIIGDVTIGPATTVWPGAVLRGDDAAIRIGARTSVQDGVVIHTGPDIDTVIGDECTIGHLAHLEGPTIAYRALIGAGSIVLREATVGEMALVGAGALVPGGMDVPARAIAVGVPAKLRLDAVTEDVEHDLILDGMQRYVQRGEWYRRDLRRIS